MKVTLPLSIEQIKQVLNEQIEIIDVDIVNSKLKGKSALVYLGNLELGKINFITDGMDFATKKELLIEYMKLKNIIKLDQLLYSNLQVMLAERKIDAGEDANTVLEKSLLNSQEIQQLLEDQEYLSNLSHLKDVLSSMPYYLVTRQKWFKELYPNYLDDFEVVDDANFIGFTFVNYLGDLIFQHHYYVHLPIDNSIKPKYFRILFDDYIYKGKSLFAFFTQNNIMLPIMNMITEGELTPETLKEHNQEIENATSL
jgi:hypothetical protein